LAGRVGGDEGMILPYAVVAKPDELRGELVVAFVVHTDA
jgi:acyl-coenzyme A synthetase/AMP-(fatty) acid ligase